ncbi:MAG: YraN family protein [Thermoleophilia bacterium]
MSEEGAGQGKSGRRYGRRAAAGPRPVAADPRRGRGQAGEDLARRHLEAHGYEIIETNFRTRYGEIDIIARRGELVAFIEVKARRSSRCGEPFEAVGPRKQNQIRRLAQVWVAAHQSDSTFRQCAFRFDVIGIMLDAADGAAQLIHMEDAFR